MKTKKTKSIYLLLLTCLLSACSNATSTSESETTSETESEVVSISEKSSESESETETESETITESETSESESEAESESESESTDPYATYYASVDTSSSDALLTTLQNLMFDTHTHYTSYGEIRDLFFYSDPDPDVSGNIISFYSKTSIDGTWDAGATYNREHVWPQANSGGLYSDTGNNTKGAGGDLHHIRPTLKAENSARGNKLFGNYIPNDNVKGDCARIVMYMYVHYSNEITYTGSSSNYSTYTGAMYLTNIFTDLSLIAEWNALDPVDDLEMVRNDYCYSLCGNRNPFIDHPEWINTIFA